MGRDNLEYDELEYHFTKKRFLWNQIAPIFPPIYIFDCIYILQKIFPRYDHYHNGNRFLGWVAKYHKLELWRHK